MRLSILLCSLLLSATTHAAIFKCVKNGQTAFQDSPCDAASKSETIELPGAASGQIAWGGLEFGMSPAQVRKVKPSAVPGTGDRLFDGTLELLRIESVTFAGLDFEASYMFKSDALTQVHLAGPMSTENTDNVRNFERVVAELRKKYGAESQRELSNESSGLNGGAEWNHATGKASVVLVPITATTSMLKVIFVLARGSRA